MGFLKGIWGFLVAIKDALALLVLLMLFGLLWAAWLSGSPAIRIEDGSALEIRLDGVLVDQASDADPLAFLSVEEVIPETETARLVKVIDAAASDPAISMITLDLSRFMGGGLANLESVGNALNRFRASKKPVWAYATAYGDDGYFLASHADRISLSPQGAVMLSGPGGNNLYFKNALDRLKVNVEVFRVGTYKSFVEPFTRNESSPEARSAEQQLVNDIWVRWRTGVEGQRKNLNIAALLESWPARVAGANTDQAVLAKNAGLVDEVLSENDWRRKLKEKLGDGAEPERPGDYRRVLAHDYWAVREPLEETGPGVAVVHVAGSIVDGDVPLGEAGGDTVSGLIADAVADSDVKALVLRVDSGGGSVLASEQIRLALEDARARKLPVIASFGPVAASGGYWVATAADMIFASPSTVTGSIGVFGIIPTFERTLEQIGVSTDGVKTTEFSGQPDVLGGLNEPTRLLIQSGVKDVYQQFLSRVSTARKMPVAQVEALAEGRVWSGVRAKELGLIDRFGDLDAAIAEAGRRAGLKGTPRTIDMRPEPSLLVAVLQKLEGQQVRATAPRDVLAANVLAARMKAASQVHDTLRIANGPTVQASCLGCGLYRVAAPARRAGPEDLLAMVGKLLH